MVELGAHQVEAIKQMKNGCILCGDVGTGKSRTALAYYLWRVTGGSVPLDAIDISGRRLTASMSPMKKPRDLYIITTAQKRDKEEWDEECEPFLLGDTQKTDGIGSLVFGVKVTIDSWNNIKKYQNVYGAFFIFDEQRVVGYGAWTKAFLKITNKNQWILLSATPGDKWEDYIPVFIANGFYKNKTDFCNRHAIFNPFTPYRKIQSYYNVRQLEQHRSDILVDMVYARQTIRHRMDIWVDYDKRLYRTVWRDRWNPYDNCPIDETGKLCYLMRRVVNSDPSRIQAMHDILDERRKAIVFYNHDYELDILRQIALDRGLAYAEWNGQNHDAIPDGDAWLYIVQYIAGSEGWNCTTTDTIIFYSQSYSYRQTAQAEGRIDRMNTPYTDLCYYYLKSHAPIDLAIAKALKAKKKFNESSFVAAGRH
jgi:hypothetical protein